MATFTITSGLVVLSDPCYDMDSTYQGMKFNVPAANGEWYVTVEKEDGRVASWKARRADSIPTVNTVFKTEEFGVDSGQFGIFDMKIYNPTQEEGFTPFYQECMDKTLDDNRSGVIMDKGFCSSTGYGDGCYQATLEFNQDVLTAIEIIFMEEEEEFDFDGDDD